MLETLVLSVLNHDCAIAAAAARMVTAARGRSVIEMGSRRTHEEAAVAAARAAYLAGFAQTSNLEAGRRFGVPTTGTAAHAFTLLHDDEPEAFASQVARFGQRTTLLVDTYDITQGIRNAIAAAGPGLGAIRIDSGDLSVLAAQSRQLLDSLGAVDTKIVVSGDLDEYSIAALAAEPVDAYGAGTAVVTGSGAPTAGLVYKLVEVDGRPVVKRSENKATIGGRKTAVRRHKPTGTATEEVVVSQADPAVAGHDRLLQRRYVQAGQPVADRPSLEDSANPPAGLPHLDTVGGSQTLRRRSRHSGGHPRRDTMSRALIIVDVQRDFCEGGSLPVNGGAGVAAAVSALLQDEADRWDHVVATQDHHIDPGAHFGNPPDYVDTWPVHCVVGTTGVDFHPNLDTDHIDAVFTKGEHAAAYSGFEGHSGGIGLAAWLKMRDVSEVDIVGIATDHCVRATALDSAAEGFATTVLLDLTAGVAEPTTTAALTQLTDAHVTLVGTPILNP